MYSYWKTWYQCIPNYNCTLKGEENAARERMRGYNWEDKKKKKQVTRVERKLEHKGKKNRTKSHSRQFHQTCRTPECDICWWEVWYIRNNRCSWRIPAASHSTRTLGESGSQPCSTPKTRTKAEPREASGRGVRFEFIVHVCWNAIPPYFDFLCQRVEPFP